MKAIALIFLVLPALVAAAHDLQATYPFRTTLFNDQGQYYGLYWNFSIPEATIHFAVNVSTTGWVGFGVSPNGQMPGSDVIIGWVADDGTAYFHDRFADARSRPPIDESQDWFLISGEEENGFTILEFSRNWTTCDPRDLEIMADTSRVVWSFQANDPTDPLGNTATFHDHQGSASLNLLGGLTNPPADPEDVQSFDIGVTNVTIPHDVDTTYWCLSGRLPQEVTSQERYIVRISPNVSPHEKAYVHHMLIYLCLAPLNESQVGESGDCDNGVSPEVRECLQGLLIAAWAVGGEEFVYPENVAYPIGGPGAQMFTIIQMHYDNPSLDAGVVDSSGFTLHYTSIPREHNAGIMYLGHFVNRFMVVPPRANNYTIAGLCPHQCTNSYLPEDGIHIFGDMLHTHLAGHGITLRHLRWNSECGGLEELKPIDQNLRYDFNFQQITHLPRDVIVLPNDTLVLECFYNTSGRSGITVGGESTRQEMCLTFPVYYPRLEGSALDFCASGVFPNEDGSFPALEPFVEQYGASNPEARTLIENQNYMAGLNAFNWSQPGIVDGLEDSILHNGVTAFCINEDGDSMVLGSPDGIPEVKCPYQPVDKCTSEVDGAVHGISQAGVVVGVTAMILSLLLL